MHVVNPEYEYLPGKQSSHCSCPIFAPFLPGAHSRQVLDMKSENVPIGQVSHMVAGNVAYVPERHGVQIRFNSLYFVPFSHLIHSSVVVNWLHCLHIVCPLFSSLYFPFTHFSHSDKPCWCPNVPRGQGLQKLAFIAPTVIEYFPIVQSWQFCSDVLPDKSENFPGGHWTQLRSPVVSAYLPPLQVWQIVDALVSEYLPFSHCWHEVALEMLENVPPTHSCRSEVKPIDT
jgi:hypothetical protein